MNTGSMLIRANPEVHEFLALVRACGDQTPGASEQDCMRDVVGVNKDIPNHPLKSDKWAKKTIMIPQKTMNAFPEEIRCQELATDERPSGLWQPGDFVVHFAGAWAHVKEEDPTGYLMQKYRGYVDRW
jgi:mannan polymerase II complex MNN10 subunit